MFKKQIEFRQLKPVLYKPGEEPEVSGSFIFGVDNKLYRSLMNLFETFYIRTKPRRELFLVGGCVRDMLLDKEPKDYDLCTNATPDEVKQICDKIGLKYFDSGIKHGTLTIIDDFYCQSYEITTYRVDGKYTDGRHPDEVAFTASLEEDLKRRDFTINSFAYNLLTKELLALDESYFRDLELGIIRTVGNPIDRFGEDALRMLRALRFAAQLNFTIQRDTYAAIKELAPKIALISKERIRDELTKILLSDNPQVLELFVITGLEPYAFDGITPIGDILNCEHQNPWHYADVFHHTMDVVKRVPKTFELRWAALMHDFGKPAVKELKDDTTEYYHYHGHQEVSANIAEKLADLLKFSNDQKDIVYKFVKYHDEPLAEVRNAKFKAIVNEIGKDNFLNFIKLRAADAFAHRLLMGTKFAIDFPDIIKERFSKIINEDQALKVADLKINGYDLINLGLQGKQIGDCLNYLLELVLEDATLNMHDTLIDLAKKFIENL